MKTTMIYLRQLLALCVVMVAFAACGDDEKNEGGSSSASGIQLNTIDKITCLSEESTIDINITKKRLPLVSATKAPIVGITTVAGIPGQFRFSKKTTINKKINP